MISVTAEGPRGRKEYTLTDAGLAELRSWLTGTKPQRNTRSDLLLRVFFLGVLTPEQARGYLTELIDLSQEGYENLRRLEESVDWDDDSLSVHGRIALEYGLRFNAMRRDWARWAADQIR
jgi:DNA-binding PadR family transcriptional regulator